MPAITTDDLARMRDHLLFTGPTQRAKLTRFWTLMVLASVIASAGVVADSTATVIGAMIVAPLMTPILGTVLSVSTGDRANLVRSVLLVAGGSLAAIAVGYVIGLVTTLPVDAATSSQVDGRVSPRLIDLIAAIATGAVGAFAQCREDVSDTLPGVAIAISLVPPLAVVGLTLESGATSDAWGALLLFGTNVGAILLTGSIVMGLFGVPARAAAESGQRVRRTGIITLFVAFVVLLAVPLGRTSYQLTTESQRRSDVRGVASDWADAAGWRIAAVGGDGGTVTVLAVGRAPAPDTDALRTALDAAGLGSVDVRIELVPETVVELPGR